jgi:hypothetical protein
LDGKPRQVCPTIDALYEIALAVILVEATLLAMFALRVAHGVSSHPHHADAISFDFGFALTTGTGSSTAMTLRAA